MSKYNLLSVNQDAKTSKGNGDEYITAIQYLAPAKQVLNINVCPMAVIAGCEKACLYSAGRGAFNNVQQARIRKTMLWRDDRSAFLSQLCGDIDKFQAYCERKDVQPCVRLNGTSDIRFERFEVMQSFPKVKFYDYTKDIRRAYKKLPDNYHLTLSYSEANMDYAKQVRQAAKDTGRNMAVVFRSKHNIPEFFAGMKTIDGDKDDLRFLDPEFRVVALYAKGAAKKDTSGFVIDVN